MRIIGRAITGCHPNRVKRQSDSIDNLTIETSEALFEHQISSDDKIRPLVIKLGLHPSLLIGPNYKLVVRDDDESDHVVLVKNVSQSQLPNCLFRGFVEGRKEAQVAISTCGQTLVSDNTFLSLFS